MSKQKFNSKYEQACDLYDMENYKDAYKIFFELAKVGNIDAQNVVGNLLILGMGVEENKTEGYFWYKKAAYSGHPEALYIYGTYCIDNKNEKEGLSYIEKAAELEYPTAVYYLAVIYDQGLYEYKQNRKLAFDMYKKAFKLGEKIAYRALLNLYKEENGSFKMAIYLLKNLSWIRVALAKAK